MSRLQGNPPGRSVSRYLSGRPAALLLLLLLALILTGASQTPGPAACFPPPRWQPWMGAPAGAHDVDPKLCIGCHSSEAFTQVHTPMAHGSEDIRTTTILTRHPHLEIHNGRWLIRIDRKGDQSIYSVTDGKQTLAVPSSGPSVWATPGRPTFTS